MEIEKKYGLWLLTLAIPFFLGACTATVPARLAQGPFANITQHMAQTENLVGQRVRWGGSIASVNPAKNETCIQVVSHPLDSAARPEDSDQTDGRFVACAPAFYDPAVYAIGRDVTVVGILQSPQSDKIGKYDYLFPRVAADDIYLWPKPKIYQNYYPYPYYSPFAYPMMGPWPEPW
jgi:outer membrane lipoprotein